MKNLSLLLGLIFSLSVIAESKKIETQEFENNDSFFLTGKGFLILPDNLAAQFTNKNEKWQKVPAEKFEGIGIKNGTEIKYVNFKTGELQTYKIGTFVNVVSIYDSMIEKDRTAYLLLKDDPKGVEVPGDGGADYYDGIAYTGKEFKITSFNPNAKYPFDIKNLDITNNEVKKIVSIYNKNTPDKFIQDSSNVTYLGKSEIYQIFGKSSGPNYTTPVSGNGLVLKNGNQYFDIGSGWTPTDYSSATIGFRVLQFLEGPDWVISVNEQGMHTCFDLYISKSGKIRRIPMYCDSGGC